MHGITERYLSGQKADAAGFVRKLLHDLESKISVQFGRVSLFSCHKITNCLSLLVMTSALFSSLLRRHATRLREMNVTFVQQGSYPIYQGFYSP
jgi:hypothetical protein